MGPAAALAFTLLTPNLTVASAEQAPAAIPGDQISGRVTDASGKPIKGVRVGVLQLPLSRDGQSKQATTDANGSYRLDRLPPGSWSLGFAGEGVELVGRVDLPADRGVEANLVICGRDNNALIWHGAPSERLPVQIGPAQPPPAKVHDVRPIYPAIARAAGMTGTVEMDVIIAEDGTVRQLRIVKSKPMLDSSAMDAVLQWRFAPTVIDGVPTAVRGLVAVPFK
jgi:TonB family protein